MLYPIGLCFAQLLIVRTAIAWNHDNISDVILSYSGIQWHLMGFTLFATTIFGIKALYELSIQSNMIDVNSTAKIIQNLVKSAMLIIIILDSILVFIYKIRSSSTTTADSIDNEVPRMYASLLNWELVQPLDQVMLGKLIYNYGGAGLFVLGGLFYVTKRAHLMDLVQEEGDDDNEEEEGDDDDNEEVDDDEKEEEEDDDEGQTQAQLQAQLQLQAQGAIQIGMLINIFLPSQPID